MTDRHGRRSGPITVDHGQIGVAEPRRIDPHQQFAGARISQILSRTAAVILMALLSWSSHF
jgi:hypothetical protein